MYRYQNNAFRVVSLTSDVSIKEITQRVNEIRVKKSLDIDVSYELDFDWMGKVDRSEQNVINALQRLENPISRLKEEIFWFWIDTDTDKKAFECLVQGNRQSAHELWRSVIASDFREDEKVSALVNQMILSHSSVIGREIDLKYKEDAYIKGVCPKCNMQFGHEYRFCIECGNKLKEMRVEGALAKKRNVNLSDAHWKNWRFAINRILLIAENESFWERTKEKAGKINDPRLSVSKIQEIRESFLSDIASPNFRFLSQSLVSKDYERTKQHAALLNGSSFSYEYLREGFNGVLSSHITLIDRHCQNSAKEIADLDQRQQKSINAVVEIYSKLEKNVSGTISEGNLVDFNCISDYGLARDKLANNVKNMAIVLNNSLVADKVMPPKKRESGYQKAHEMVRKAIEYAGSQYTKQKFAKDEELIKSNMEVERSNRTYYEQTDENYYEQSETTQSTVNPGGYSSTNESSSGSASKPFFGWLLVVGCFVLIVLVANLSDDFSNNTSSKRPSSYSSQSSSSSVSLNQLKARIEALSATIEDKEGRVRGLEATIESENIKLETLKAEINDLDSRVNKAWYGKDKLIDKYNQKVNEYNAMLASYNSVYSEYQRLFDSYKQDISTHDTLVESYNTRIK